MDYQELERAMQWLKIMVLTFKADGKDLTDDEIKALIPCAKMRARHTVNAPWLY